MRTGTVLAFMSIVVGCHTPNELDSKLTPREYRHIYPTIANDADVIVVGKELTKRRLGAIRNDGLQPFAIDISAAAYIKGSGSTRLTVLALLVPERLDQPCETVYSLRPAIYFSVREGDHLRSPTDGYAACIGAPGPYPPKLSGSTPNERLAEALLTPGTDERMFSQSLDGSALWAINYIGPIRTLKRLHELSLDGQRLIADEACEVTMRYFRNTRNCRPENLLGEHYDDHLATGGRLAQKMQRFPGSTLRSGIGPWPPSYTVEMLRALLCTDIESLRRAVVAELRIAGVADERCVLDAN